MLKIIAWLAAAAFVIGYFLQPGSEYRLLMTVLWAGLGVGWLMQWRMAVKKHSQGLSQPSRPTRT